MTILARWLADHCRLLVTTVVLAAICGPLPAAAEPRIALVLGNADYARGPITNSLADAGLVADALNSIGFEIIEGADLNQTDLRRAFADFLARVDSAGPDALAFVYFSGYVLQFEGENYLVPVDARLARESDIPLEALRLSDIVRPLAGSAARAKVVAIDAARPLPLTIDVAPGLAPTEAPPGLLVAFSSAPGTFADESGEGYGAYAGALAEMVREPGLDLDAVFTGIRVRTHGLTQGRQVPWHTSSLAADIVLVPGDAPVDAPIAAAPGFAGTVPLLVRPQARPMREMDPEEAYGVAIALDRLPSYVEYVETYPGSLYAPRILVLIRARREALVWKRALEVDTREAYWTYLHRYPDGIYAADARRRLRRLAAFAAPPAGFAPREFAVPPPLMREPSDYVRAYPPLPRLPQNFVSPRPGYLTRLPPPAPPRAPQLLPPPVGLPAVSRLGEPPKRVGPPVGVVAPMPAIVPGQPRSGVPGVVRHDYVAPGESPARRFETPPGRRPAAAPSRTVPPPPPGRFGTRAPPGTEQSGAAAYGNPGAAARRARSAPPPGLAPEGMRSGVPPPGGPTAPPTPAVTTPSPQQAIAPAGSPPVVRVAPPPPPALARPAPPAVQQPATVAPPARAVPAKGAPPGKRCPIVNGVERCG